MTGVKGVVLLIALLAVAVGCSDDRVPTTIRVNPSSVSFDAVGATTVLVVHVLDQDGDTLTGTPVTWSSSNPAAVQVSGAGVVTSISNGSSTVRAEAGSAFGTTSVTVQQVPTALSSAGGTGQEGSAGESLALPLTVHARDRLGSPAQGAQVQFVVEAGGGETAPGVVVTGADGNASTVWTLGTVAGADQSVRASVSGAAGAGLETVRFSALTRAGPPSELRTEGGDGQSFRRGGTLPDPIEVRLMDRFENPIGGAVLSVIVVTGGGAVGSSTPVTDQEGRAATTWTLGSALGLQTIEVSASGLPPIVFTATALAIPASVEAVAGTGQTATAGSAVATAPEILVLDAGGLPVPSTAAVFTVTEGGGSVSPPPAADSGASGGGFGADGPTSLTVLTDATGRAAVGAWTLGTTVGAQTLLAEVSGLPPVAFQATSVPGALAALVLVSGSGQSAPASSTLPAPLVVRTEDSFGNPRSGHSVVFTPLGGQGAAAPDVAVTGVDGIASTTWTLGGVEGQQGLRAHIPGTPFEVMFTATAIEVGASGFDIQLIFTQPVALSTEQAFQEAASVWAGTMTAKLSPIPNVSLNPGDCGSPEAMNLAVDDVAILVTIEPIDGPFGVLGSAGPCLIRSGTTLTVLGRVRLDLADVERLQGDGRLAAVIIHEIGHVLGIGTLWGLTDPPLLQNPSLPDSPGVDTHFSGGAAIAAFDAVGGAAYAGGEKVPVENTQGGAGTRDGHWRLSVFGDELMVGFLGATSPMSRVTIASLADLGYSVDEGAADPYSLSLGLLDPHPSRSVIDLGDDIWRTPIYPVTPDGRVFRTEVPHTRGAPAEPSRGPSGGGPR